MTSISLLLPISSRYQESVLVDTSSADRIHSIKQDLNKMAASNHIPTSISDFVVSINRRLAFIKTTLSPDSAVYFVSLFQSRQILWIHHSLRHNRPFPANMPPSRTKRLCQRRLRLCVPNVDSITVVLSKSR